MEDKTVSKWALANGMINGQTSANYKYERMNQEIDESITYRKSVDWGPNDRPSHRVTDRPTNQPSEKTYEWVNEYDSERREWKNEELCGQWISEISTNEEMTDQAAEWPTDRQNKYTNQSSWLISVFPT